MKSLSSLFTITILAFVLLGLKPALTHANSEQDCNRPNNHPLIDRIEEIYGIPFEDFAVYYCQGITPTAIAQAMYLAQLTGTEYTYWLDLLADPQQYSASLAALGLTLADISPAQALFLR